MWLAEDLAKRLLGALGMEVTLGLERVPDGGKATMVSATLIRALTDAQRHAAMPEQVTSPDTRADHVNWSRDPRSATRGPSRVIPGSSWEPFLRSLRMRSITPICPNRLRTTCRGASLIRNSAPLEPYSRTMPRALWWPKGLGGFLRARFPRTKSRRAIHGLSRSRSWSRYAIR